MLSQHALQLVANSDYFSHFKPGNLQGMLLWINDKDQRIIDLTPAMAGLYCQRREDMIGRYPIDFMMPKAAMLSKSEHARIRRLGLPHTVTLWTELPIGWRKVIMTRAPLDRHYIIGVAQDITEQGLLNRWLLNLDLEEGTLPLGPRYQNAALTWPELIVLHRISRSRPYKAIAEELHISQATVRYRINRVRDKLGAENIDDMWEEIYTSGLVHVLSLPLEPDHAVLNRRDLMRLDPTTTAPPRHSRRRLTGRQG